VPQKQFVTTTIYLTYCAHIICATNCTLLTTPCYTCLMIMMLYDTKHSDVYITKTHVLYIMMTDLLFLFIAVHETICIKPMHLWKANMGIYIVVIAEKTKETRVKQHSIHWFLPLISVFNSYHCRINCFRRISRVIFILTCFRLN